MPQGENPQGDETLTSQSGAGSQPFTKEDAIKLVNSAISTRFAAFEKKADASTEALKQSFAAVLEEKLSALAPKGGTSEGAGGQPSNDEVIANHPLMKGMQKKLSDMEAAAAKARAEADAERARTREQAMRTNVSDALIKNGVDPARARHALGFLVDTDKRVFHNEAGDVVFRDADGTEMDLETGLKSWMKGDDAKYYLPARGTNGSGAAPGSRPPMGAGQKPMGLGATLLANTVLPGRNAG